MRGAAAIRCGLVACALLLGACGLLRRDPGDVTTADVLRAYTHAYGVGQSGDLTLLGLPVAALGRDRVVVVHASRENWRIRVAEIRSLSDNRVIAEKALPLHALNTGGADTVQAMKVRSDNEIVFAGSNGELVIWTIASDQLRYLSNRAANRAIYAMAFLSDGRLVIHDSNADHHFEIWDIDAGTLVAELPGAQSFAALASGNLLLARDEAFEELDAHDFRVVRHYPRPAEHAVELAVLPDGRLLEQGYSGVIRVWNLRVKTPGASPELTIAATRDDWNLHATYQRDGYILASAPSDEDAAEPRASVRAWSSVDGTPKPAIALPPSNGDDRERRVVAFAPLDHHRVATIEQDGTTKIWDLRDARLLRDYPASLKDYVED